MSEENSTTTTESDEPTFAEGSWQETLHKSAVMQVRSNNARKRASEMLWTGAKAGIEGWLPKASTDVSAEQFGQQVTAALGAGRKGDASKIKTVALAVRNNGLELDQFPNLAKAYGQAIALTKTAAKEADEDEAADKAIATLAKNAPKSSSTPEGAALIVLSKGVDEAARLLLDALGTDEKAHRALLRAISQEIAGRVKPKPAPKAKAGPKAGATQAKKGAATKAKAAPKAGAAKAKPVVAKAAPKAGAAKAKPVVQRAKPVAKA